LKGFGTSLLIGICLLTVKYHHSLKHRMPTITALSGTPANSTQRHRLPDKRCTSTAFRCIADQYTCSCRPSPRLSFVLHINSESRITHQFHQHDATRVSTAETTAHSTWIHRHWNDGINRPNVSSRHGSDPSSRHYRYLRYSR